MDNKNAIVSDSGGVYPVPTPKEMLYPKKETAKELQIGGDHYKDMAIQPGEYITKNKLNWYEGNVIKYVTRHQKKNRQEDIKKAIHYLQLMLEQYEDLYGK